MSFVSSSFFLFFPTVTILYFLLPHRFRWFFLLLASCVFYMAFIPAYILVLFALIAVDYTIARFIEKSEGHARHLLLVLSIAATAGALFIFKYFNFFNANIALLAHAFHLSYPAAVLSLAVPLGLSFHTFQSLSYVIEVYRRKWPAERHFGIYALYVMFYPQLVAGPIERPQHLLPQLHAEHTFDYERVKFGLMRMVWGFFKKMVVAQHLALVVDRAFASPESFDGSWLLIASLFFTLQLYFDFSAYCDIAIGAAQVMGFTLMENFNRPFAAKSMTEFWHRWHISLSSWFRDYFYYPILLTQKTMTPPRIYATVLLTFLVTGFWHGANWTFGIFGLLHGLYIVIGSMTQRARSRFYTLLGLLQFPRFYRALQVSTIFILMSFTCIFFRAPRITIAWYIIAHLFDGTAHLLDPEYLTHLIARSGLSLQAFGFIILSSAFVFVVEYWGREEGIFVRLSRQSIVIRWASYWGITAALVLLSEAANSAFIYFQF